MIAKISFIIAVIYAKPSVIDELLVNQTIKVDEYLNFTYMVEKLPSVELFGLVPNLTDPVTGEDQLVETLIGHFELNMTEKEGDWEEENSMRFCLQMYPKFNSDGTLNKKGQNSEQSERYRMRFFNKKLNEFDFYPQIAYPYISDDGTDIKKNIDWNFRTNGQTAKKDYLDKLCSLSWNPLRDGTTPYYIAADLSESTESKYTEEVKT